MREWRGRKFNVSLPLPRRPDAASQFQTWDKSAESDCRVIVPWPASRNSTAGRKSMFEICRIQNRMETIESGAEGLKQVKL
jgi:hypothetical protein